MRRPTITRSLFLRIAPTILITVWIIGVIAFKSATSQINHVYDAQLISSANMMWLVVEDETKDAAINDFRRLRKIDLSVSNQRDLNKFANDYADSRMFRVWKSGRLVMVSDGGPRYDVPRQVSGFSNVRDDDDAEWRIYSVSIPHTKITIEAGEKISLRHALVENILLTISAPLVLLVPLVGLLLWVGISGGLKTIRALVGQIRSRSPDDLSHISLQGVPLDLVPLGRSINQLLTKLEHSFTAEKRFAEHAAHHLRTPLAALKLQMQLLSKARDEGERTALLADLTASIDRASRLVGQLLTSTRVSHQPINRVPIALHHIIFAILDDLAPIAAQKNIDLSFDGPEDAVVLADETLLRLMVGNVVENALKYTPEEGRVQIELTTDETQVHCAVSDSGPGIPEAERALVFERFYRVGTPKAEGTGLGLAIVAEIVARLSGSIRLETAHSGQGLRVELNLPRA